MRQNYQIIVGVDGSDGGRRALLWAVHEAAARGGTVQALTAWRWDDTELPPPATATRGEDRDRAARMLTHEIDAVPAHRRSGVPIAMEVVEGRAADVLTAAARGADLLVLGSHGHSRVWHTVLGSVSEECIQKATCPVVVVPVPHAAAQPQDPAVMR
jgi:nucleotide-binding universal stress UspA family protein